MTFEHWFDKSPNGRAYLLSDVEELHIIYKKINLSSNSAYPKLQLTIDEEAMMRTFYHAKIRDICGALDYSFMVEYDAHMMLHKYFLKYGILENDTKHAMLACIYLGTKTQNMHITMDNFVSKITNTQSDLIIQLEVVILAANNFKLPQFSPIPCLYGFVFDSLSILNRISEYQEFSQKALDRLQIAVMFDDVMLIESPSHIALACVLDFDKSFEVYWEERLKKLDNIISSFDKIKVIRQKIEEFQEISADLLRPIDRKIRMAKSEFSE